MKILGLLVVQMFTVAWVEAADPIRTRDLFRGGVYSGKCNNGGPACDVSLWVTNGESLSVTVLRSPKCESGGGGSYSFTCRSTDRCQGRDIDIVRKSNSKFVLDAWSIGKSCSYTHSGR